MTRLNGRHVATLVLIAALGGCNGDDGPNCSQNPAAAGCEPPPTTQPACTQAVALQSTVPGLPTFNVAYVPVTTATTGRLDVTVDWTFPATPFAVYFVRGTCTIDQLNARTCDFILRSEAATTPKPRRLSASNIAAGGYQIIVGNAGTQTESSSIQVVVSSSSCPAIISTGVGASRVPEVAGEWQGFRTVN